jgi:hypothetical protein
VLQLAFLVFQDCHKYTGLRWKFNIYPASPHAEKIIFCSNWLKIQTQLQHYFCDMPTLCLVGNCPSSGSTFLADLLDSSSHTACGPELEFFCNPDLYRFENYRHRPKTGSIGSLRPTGIFHQHQSFPAYGLTKKAFKEMIQKASSLQVFFDQFAGQYLQFRKKSMNGVVFEKSPANSFTAAKFLAANPKGYFIHLVRNPLNVYASLRKRGLGKYTACSSWLIDVAPLMEIKDHPRLITISYEDLISKPYELTSDLIFRVSGLSIPSSDIQEAHLKNHYRASKVKRIRTWEVKNNVMQVKNANTKHIPDDILEDFASAMYLRIGKKYARHYGLPTVHFIQAIHHFGYYEVVCRILHERKILVNPTIPKPEKRESRKLKAKWIREVLKGHLGIQDFEMHRQAVELELGGEKK